MNKSPVPKDPAACVPAQPPPTSGEEARAFLQERLAFLGLAYGLIGIAFYVVSNLLASTLPQHSWVNSASRLVMIANGTYLAQWLVCRKGQRSADLLRVIDAVSAAMAAACSAFLVFSSFPGEIAGLSYARSLLMFTFGVLMRAVVVPSSARRTFALGLITSSFPVATAYVWFTSQGPQSVPPALTTFFTADWCLGAVVISTLASRVIFGLRQEVRQARQLGQYTLLEKIGEGGMGAVYRASHAMLRRPTAVKLLRPENTGSQRLERFEREVQLTSSLTHPNTVGVFDYGRTPEGVFYYAMEYLDGLNLEDLVRLDGPQPPGRVIHVLRQVAGSLTEAHGIGLIHRDIKPANVILVAERGGAPDVAKVVDFGLVKDLHQDVHLTNEAALVGTPHYLSPEAIRAPLDVDARSDLYSLGCVAYYLLTGHTPFEGKTVIEVAGHHLSSRPLPLRERLGRPVPETLSDLVLSCLEKNPESRPRSARDFIASLDACRDVPAWTDDEARSWWSAQGARIVPRARGRGNGNNLDTDEASESAWLSTVHRAAGPGDSVPWWGDVSKSRSVVRRTE